MALINSFDAAVIYWIQEHCRNIVTDRIFPVITYLGELGCFWVAVGLALLIKKSTRPWGIGVLAALLAGALTGEVLLKNLICRPRPFQVTLDNVMLIFPPSGYSFPSGHACSSFAAATVLMRWSKKWGVPAMVLAALIAFSRVYLFVHWPTDVLAGAALGVCFGSLSAWAVGKWQREKSTENE